MAQFVSHFVQDLREELRIRHCGSIVFNADDLSNVVSVELYDNGAPASLSGTVVGAVRCPDGATVPLTNGAISGNTASITLTAACFAVPGQIGVGIQIVSGSTKTTVLKAMYNVVRFETDNVIDPDSRLTISVADLVDDIADAVASIPADYSDLLAAIAPTFSTSTAYPAGAFVWYDGTLYRFTQAHIAGTWNAAEVTAAVIANSITETSTALKNVAPAIVETAAGDPATFTDGADGYPAQELQVAIDTADGCTAAVISVRAVNAWDEEWEVGGIDWATGQNNDNETDRIRSKNYIHVMPGTAYYFANTAYSRYVWCYDADKTLITNVSGSNNFIQLASGSGEFTTPANCCYIRFDVWTEYGTTYNHDLSINYPATDTGYHAAAGDTYTVTFPAGAGTVYDAVLNVTSGALTVDPQGTPATYQCQPTEVRTVLGLNNIYADVGNVAVIYCADTKLYIDNKIAAAIANL